MHSLASKLFTWRRRPPPLTVFGYHSVVEGQLPARDFCFVPVEVFRKQLDAIIARYTVLPLEVALERLWTKTLRGPAAVLTFDDGFRSNHDVALPILRSMGLPATLFLCTGPVVEQKTLWFARIHRAVCLTDRKDLEWQGESYELRCAAGRAKTSARWQAKLKRLHPAELEPACDNLCELLGVEPPGSADVHFGMLNQAMLTAMQRSGLFTFGAHTRRHPILSFLSREGQQAEIAESADDITMLIGEQPRLFAYPNGRREDFNGDSRAVLHELGFKAAFTSVAGTCHARDPRFQLPRVLLGDTHWEERILK